MPLTSERHADVVNVRIDDTLDRNNAPAADAQLRALLGGTRRLCIDLSELARIDSAGLAVLVVCADRCRAAGAAFAITAVSEPARRWFDLTGLDRVLLDGAAR